MYVNRKVLELGREPDSLLAFFHAQRTGGSTFLRWLGETFPKSQIFSRPTTGESFTHWKKIEMARLDGYRVFGGFSQFFEKDGMTRPFVGFSLVRHPFHRICSVYEMSRRDPLHYRHQQAIRATFEQFYREVDEEEPSYFRNLMCNRICNAPSADTAMETMERRFGAVSITTRLCDMTALMAATYGWSAKPVKPIAPDEERYQAYEGSAVFDDIMEKSADDLRLFEYVRDFAERLAEEPKTPAVVPAGVPAGVPAVVEVRPDAPSCPVCRAPIERIGDKGECPSCNSPARTRSLPPVIEQVVAPQLAKMANRGLPLLAFAATGWERKLLAPHFAKLQGASLYGKYSADNMTGVDVRDLSRFEPASFSGAFGILLFDYFPEHEKALAELARVIAPGGILFTLILPARVQPDRSPPVVTRAITPRPGYFDYVPEGQTLLNVNVGQDWLLAAIAQAGFAPLQLRVADGFTDEVSQWFVGVRRDGVAPKPMKIDAPAQAASPPAAPAKPAPVKPAPVKPAPVKPAPAKPASAKPALRPALRPAPTAPALAKQTRMTDAFAQEFVCPLEGYDGLKSVTVRLTVPSVPYAGRRTDFAEHRWLAGENRSGTEVTCVGPGEIMISNDLGKSWDVVAPPELAGKQMMNHFTTQAGTRLVQLTGWSEHPDLAPGDAGAVYRLDADFAVTGHTQNSGARWHGPRAIGEQGGVILYSDYFDNARISSMKPGTPEWDEKLRTCHVWRSDDDGRSWRSVFSKAPTEIRHFHFVMADPYAPGTWWLSSGDKPQECRCWRSRDNGASWQEVTNPAPDIRLHPLAQRSLQAAFRATDMAILPDTLIWGTDDILVFNDEYKLVMVDDLTRLGDFPAMGARVMVAPKSDLLQPHDIGVGGHPFRNLVDVGPGYIAFTEAKYAPIGFEPVVYFIAKEAPHRMQRLFSVPQTRDKGTGFSYSRASRAAVDGRFFSFRGAGDLTNQVPRLLQWDVAFA